MVLRVKNIVLTVVFTWYYFHTSFATKAIVRVVYDGCCLRVKGKLMLDPEVRPVASPSWSLHDCSCLLQTYISGLCKITVTPTTLNSYGKKIYENNNSNNKTKLIDLPFLCSRTSWRFLTKDRLW